MSITDLEVIDERREHSLSKGIFSMMLLIFMAKKITERIYITLQDHFLWNFCIEFCIINPYRECTVLKNGG